MKYAVWFVRLVFATWMIPSGINHFIPIFPQPMGSQPLSHELIVALIDSHLFDLVKAVELIAGICVLTGFFAPLALILCMPVSFCVFFWDAPLEGWGSRAALFGYSVLFCNVVLCLAYTKSYREMFAAVRRAAGSKSLLLAGRVAFGAWMLANGINHFFFPLWAEPVGQAPLAVQLMAAFTHSGLFDVAMGIELVTGALLLAGLLVPAALCVVMPVSTCALYWTLLDQRPMGIALALVAFALNGLLMLACIGNYRGALQRQALSLGEDSGLPFDSLFVHAGGRAARSQFLPALLTLLATVAFYFFLVKNRTGMFSMLVLLVPALALHARRLHDMGHGAWLLVVPALLMVGSFAIWLKLASFGTQMDAALPPIALAVSAITALWCCLGRGKSEPGRSGAPAAV